jgi:hypothetical protein
MFGVCYICPVATFISSKAQYTGLKKTRFCSGLIDVTFGCNFHLQIKMIEPELHSPASSFVECDILSHLSVTARHPHASSSTPTQNPFGTASLLAAAPSVL